jgi:cytochrome c
MKPETAAFAPIPHDLTLPLPVPREILLVLLIVSFMAHLLFVNMMVGGSFLTWIFEFIGVRKKSKAWDSLAHLICQTITVNKSLAVVLGVAPLLVINVAYTIHFYSANALTGFAWILIVPCVIVAFLLTYAQKYFWYPLENRKGFHLAIGGGASLLFLFIPLIFLTNINLMLFPERWAAVRGFFSALLLPNVVPRYIHFLLASFAATGLFLVWKTRRGEFVEVESFPEFSRDRLIRLFYRITFHATLVQLGAGVLVFFTLPTHGVTLKVAGTIFTGVFFVFLLIYLLKKEVESSPEEIGKRWGKITTIFTVVVLFMVSGRHLYREESTRWHREAMAAKTAEFIKQSEVARVAFEKSGGGLLNDPMELGKVTYKSTCSACHQAAGQGLPGAFPPLAGSEWVNDADPGKVIRIVLNGVQGPITVKGTVYQGVMPSHKDLLDDRKVAAILTYIRSSWGNQGGAVKPEEVAKIRAEVSSRASAWTEAELGHPSK